jgi:hypothetical protein
MSFCWFQFAGNCIDIIYIGACGDHVFQGVVINIVSVFPDVMVLLSVLILTSMSFPVFVWRGTLVVFVLFVFLEGLIFLVYCVVFFGQGVVINIVSVFPLDTTHG